MLKDQIRSATKKDIFYHRKIRAFKSNYVLMLRKADSALYCSNKKILQKTVKKHNIDKKILIFAWDSNQQRYDLCKLDYFI